MLAFFMDQHIRSEITAGLRARGVDVLTAFDDGSSQLEDDALLERSTSLNRVLVTQDQDFLAIVAHWQKLRREFAGVAFAIQQDVDIGGTIEYLELIARLLSPDEMQNRVEFIPSRR